MILFFLFSRKKKGSTLRVFAAAAVVVLHNGIEILFHFGWRMMENWLSGTCIQLEDETNNNSNDSDTKKKELLCLCCAVTPRCRLAKWERERAKCNSLYENVTLFDDEKIRTHREREASWSGGDIATQRIVCPWTVAARHRVWQFFFFSLDAVTFSKK